MEFGDILLAIAAKELYITKGLGTFAFNSEAAVAVLDIMRRGDDVVGDLEKTRFVAAVRTFEQVCDGRWIKWFGRGSLLHLFPEEFYFSADFFTARAIGLSFSAGFASFAAALISP